MTLHKLRGFNSAALLLCHTYGKHWKLEMLMKRTAGKHNAGYSKEALYFIELADHPLTPTDEVLYIRYGCHLQSIYFPSILQKNRWTEHVENGYVERPGKVLWPFAVDIGQFRNTFICRGRAATGKELHFRSLKLQRTPRKSQNSAMHR